jgi:molybdopterin synthase catalytic subunit
MCSPLSALPTGTSWPSFPRLPVAEGRYLTRQPLDPAALLAAVSQPGLGGAVLFLGTTRRGAEDGPVTAIEYTAYEEMVAAEFDRILEEVATRWPGGRVAACHRLGTVPAGEASIAIAAAMPHRAEAFAACRYVIEEAKRRLPVWKREIMDDGTRRWRANATAAGEAAGEAEGAGGTG